MSIMRKPSADEDAHWTSANLIKLADKHIQRYERLVAMGEKGHPNVRLSECQELLEVWQGIKEAEGDLAQLSMRQFREVEEAIEDEKTMGEAVYE